MNLPLCTYICRCVRIYAAVYVYMPLCTYILYVVCIRVVCVVFSRVHVYMCVGSNLTRGSSFFFGKVTALGVLCCFVLLFV